MRTVHLITRHLARCAIIFGSIAVGITDIAGAQELRPPPSGRRLEYACRGPDAYRRSYVMKSADGDMLRYELADGTASARKQLWLTGTTLYAEVTTPEGSARVLSGLDAFSALRTLSIGSQVESWIVEQDVHGATARSLVTVAITGQKTYLSEAFGALPVTVLEQVWKTGDRVYLRTAYIDHERATTVYWKNRDPDGKIEECDLVVLVDP